MVPPSRDGSTSGDLLGSVEVADGPMVAIPWQSHHQGGAPVAGIVVAVPGLADAPELPLDAHRDMQKISSYSQSDSGQGALSRLLQYLARPGTNG